jgi:hypothetical protein
MLTIKLLIVAKREKWVGDLKDSPSLATEAENGV